VIHIYNKNNPNIKTVDNPYGLKQDFEVGLDGVSPSQAAKLAETTITQKQSTQILRDMDVNIPNQISNPQQLNKTLLELSNDGKSPPLNPSQVTEFVRKAKELEE
jgi:hypothetical protein